MTPDALDFAAFCLYYGSKKLTMLDAAEDWVEMTPEERAPFRVDAAELRSALDWHTRGGGTWNDSPIVISARAGG